MIEIIRSQRPIAANAIKGRYLVMSLPLSAYRSMFPATPIFVEDADDNRARMQAWPIRFETDDLGVFEGMKIVRGGDNLILKRLEPFNGFICDNDSDVLTLLNARASVERIVAQAGHVSDAVIARELETLYGDIAEASRTAPAPEMERASSWQSAGG